MEQVTPHSSMLMACPILEPAVASIAGALQGSVSSEHWICSSRLSTTTDLSTNTMETSEHSAR
jgi:hypothetical protein